MKYKTYILSSLCLAIFNTTLMSGSVYRTLTQVGAESSAGTKKVTIFNTVAASGSIGYVIRYSGGEVFLVEKDLKGRLINVRIVDKGRLRPVLPTLAQQDVCRYAICLERKEVFHHGCARYFEPASDMLFNITKPRVHELCFAKPVICAICKQNL